MEYTRGPWVSDGFNYIGKGGEKVIISDGPAFGSKSTFKNAAANSRLVINSPELFELLDEIYDMVRQGAIPNFDDPWFSNTKAVLDKVKGK